MFVISLEFSVIVSLVGLTVLHETFYVRNTFLLLFRLVMGTMRMKWNRNRGESCHGLMQNSNVDLFYLRTALLQEFIRNFIGTDSSNVIAVQYYSNVNNAVKC